MRHQPITRDVDPMTVTYGTVEPGDVLQSTWRAVAIHTLPSGNIAVVAGHPGKKRTLFTGAPDQPVTVHRKAR